MCQGVMDRRVDKILSLAFLPSCFPPSLGGPTSSRPARWNSSTLRVCFVHHPPHLFLSAVPLSLSPCPTLWRPNSSSYLVNHHLLPPSLPPSLPSTLPPSPPHFSPRPQLEESMPACHPAPDHGLPAHARAAPEGLHGGLLHAHAARGR